MSCDSSLQTEQKQYFCDEDKKDIPSRYKILLDECFENIIQQTTSLWIGLAVQHGRVVLQCKVMQVLQIKINYVNIPTCLGGSRNY